MPTEPVQGERVLAHVLRHFAYTDRANAAIHSAEVRYSPITFDVARLIHAHYNPSILPDVEDVQLLFDVLGHDGRYELDPGR